MKLKLDFSFCCSVINSLSVVLLMKQSKLDPVLKLKNIQIKIQSQIQNSKNFYFNFILISWTRDLNLSQPFLVDTWYTECDLIQLCNNWKFWIIVDLSKAYRPLFIYLFIQKPMGKRNNIKRSEKAGKWEKVKKSRVEP